jgi:hypothetical protein
MLYLLQQHRLYGRFIINGSKCFSLSPCWFCSVASRRMLHLFYKMKYTFPAHKLSLALCYVTGGVFVFSSNEWGSSLNKISHTTLSNWKKTSELKNVSRKPKYISCICVFSLFLKKQNVSFIGVTYERYHESVLTETVCQNQWLPGLCPSPGIINNWKTTMRKLDMFPSLDEGEGHTVLDPIQWLSLALSNGPTEQAFPSHLRTETVEMLYSLVHVFRIPDDVGNAQSQWFWVLYTRNPAIECCTPETQWFWVLYITNPVILSVIQHHQNQLGSKVFWGHNVP